MTRKLFRRYSLALIAILVVVLVYLNYTAS
jgi:hypothetical protein